MKAAVGFFRMNVDDPYAEAELLTSLVLADPTVIEPQTLLAQLLLENRAYTGAARLYVMSINTSVDCNPDFGA